MPTSRPLCRWYIGAPAIALVAYAVALAAGPRGGFAIGLAAAVATGYFGGQRANALVTMLFAILVAFRENFLGEVPSAEAVMAQLLFVPVGLLAGYVGGECRASARCADRMQNLLTTLPEALLTADANGRVTYLNEAAEQLTGWRRNEALGAPADYVVRLGQQADSSAVPGPSVLVRRDGSERPVYAWSGRLANAGMLHVLREVVTDRRAEEEARRREEQARALLAALPVGVLLLDERGACVESNAAAHALLGCSASEAAGAGWARRLDPEKQAIAAEWKACLAHGKPYTREVRLEDARGRARWLQLRADGSHASGDARTAHLATLEDISLRKKLESDLAEQGRAHEALLQELQQQLLDAEARAEELTRARDALQARLPDLQRVDEALRREKEERGRSEEKLEQQLAEALEEADQLRRQLTEAQERAAGARKELVEARQREETLRRERQSGQDDVQRAEAALRQQLADLTRSSEAARKQLSDVEQREKAASADRLRNEESLRKQIAQLTTAEQQAREREKTLERKADELRQQAREREKTLEQKADELRRQYETASRRVEEERVLAQQEQSAREELQQQLDHLRLSSRGSQGLLDRVVERCRAAAIQAVTAARVQRDGRGSPAVSIQPLLELARQLECLWTASRLGRGDLPLDIERVELAAVVREATELCHAALTARKQHLTVILPLEPQWLSADHVRTVQALAVLLDNAVRHTPEASEVQLTADRSGDEVVLQVTDAGGLCAADLVRLQALDARAGRYADGSEHGLGLGLAVARGLAEVQGGSLEARSAGAGQGSEFVLRMPAWVEPELLNGAWHEEVLAMDPVI